MKIWAKLREDQDTLYWLSLKTHAQDTKGVIINLYYKWLSQRQRDVIKTGLSNNKIEQTIILLALVHDIGKITPSFQVKGYKYKNYKNTLEQQFEGITTQQYQYTKSPHNISGQYILKKKGFNDDFSLIIGSHHGTPIDKLNELDNQKAYSMNYYQSEESGSLEYRKWDGLHETYIQWSMEQSGFKSYEEIPDIDISAQVLLTGLLIMADWIASNENYFPMINYDKHKPINRDIRDAKGFNKWQSKEHKPELNINKTGQTVYKERFGFTPNATQEMVYNAIQETEEAGLYILEAPMGLGKTEIALISTEQLEAKFGSSGIYFGLPTQATSNAIYKRIITWLEKRGYQGTARLSHSKSYLNNDYQKLKTYPQNEENLYNNTWFNGSKKALLDQNIVATIDSFLMATLKQKHLFLRHLGLSKKVIVLDEVHAYDTYMSQYLLRSIEWMGLYKVPIIVVSATLPYDKKMAMIQSYLKGRGVKKRDIEGVDMLNHCKYPSLTYTSGRDVRQNSVDIDEQKTVRVNNVGYQDVYRVIDEWNGIEGVKGVILNNVGFSQKLAKYCHTKYPEVKTILIHSRYTDEDRSNLEKEIMSTIGKNGKRPTNILIIGTQILEQSLDIDFDVLMTEIAPMDLILQRTGRLHRHNNKRHERWQEPTIYVIRQENDLEVDKVNGSIYTPYIIAKTQVYLPERIELPQDIPTLVGKVYQNDEPEEYTNSGQYLVYKKEYETFIEQKEQRAKDYRIKGVSFRDRQTVAGWLEHRVKEDEGQARVRDIKESIEVVLVPKVNYLKCSQPQTVQDERDILRHTIRLPLSIVNNIGNDELYTTLEEIKIEKFKCWYERLYLKDKYAIILNEDQTTTIQGKTIKYTKRFGLEIN